MTVRASLSSSMPMGRRSSVGEFREASGSWDVGETRQLLSHFGSFICLSGGNSIYLLMKETAEPEPMGLSYVLLCTASTCGRWQISCCDKTWSMPSTWMEADLPPLCSMGPWPVTPQITGKST